jgi:hypothetical protein
MSEDLQKKYEEAIQALNDGENIVARDLLNEVIEEDEENVDAWVALSKAVDNDDEKRICLTTILQLDPTNSYARSELQKSEAKIEQTVNEEEIAPGITRGMVRKAAIGSAVYIVVVFLVTMIIVSSINGGKNAQRAEATQIAQDATDAVAAIETGNAEIVMTQTMESITATARAQLLITPSPTYTWTPDTSFPTWTPTPTEGALEYRVLETPPPNLPGMITGWGGRDTTNSGYVELIRLPANGLEPAARILGEFGRNLGGDVPGNTVIIERYNRQVGNADIITLDPMEELVPSQAPTSLRGFASLFEDLLVSDMQNPSLSADGSKFVVDALVRATNLREIFLVDINTNQIRQITDDGASYSTPELSQDGNRILAVRDDPNNGTDLVLIEVGTLNQIQMTTDGDALIESQPSWHTDNLQAVYTAHPPGLENNREIYTLRILPESGATALLIATGDDESNPIMNPSGAYVAFASNRGAGVYNIYIFDIATKATYQLTDSEFDTFPGGWSQ